MGWTWLHKLRWNRTIRYWLYSSLNVVRNHECHRCSGCYSEIPHWVVYEQQKLISHGSEGREAQDQEPAWLHSLVRTISMVIAGNSGMCPHMGRGWGRSRGFFYKRINPIPGAPPSWFNQFPKAPPPSTSHWALGFQRMNLGDTSIQTIATTQLFPLTVEQDLG